MKFFFDRYKKLGQNPKKINLPKTIRVNTIKISKQKLINLLNKRKIQTTPIPFLKDGLEVKARFSVGATIEYLLGLYYIQEAAAQIPVQVLMAGAKNNDKILDMCAAPGGKATQIAQYTKKNIIALDIKQKRLQALKNNIERLGTPNITVLQFDGNKASTLGSFDRILLDAPCSGNFITDADWFKKRDFKGIQKLAKMQKVLLESAYKALKKGGVLVYSTCSLEPEENEMNIHEFLKDHPDCTLQQINISIGVSGLTTAFGKELTPQLKKAKRFWPWKTNTEGFFIAKIRKK